jgi:hypothetical protein
MACGARLLLYATDTKTTGSALRQCQDDQSGGTSIPDTVKALRHCHAWGPSWAAPDEGRTPMPPGRTVDRIRFGDLGPLVTAGNMVLVQIVYEKLGKFREQFSFVGGHALTLDAYDITRGFYAVDTIPKPGSAYKGRWIPSAVIRDATDAMSGSGWVYAAWAKPKATPTPPEEDAMPDFYIDPSGAIGTVTVTDDGVALIDVQTGEHTAIKRGTVRNVFCESTVRGGRFDGEPGWMVELGERAKVLLKRNASKLSPTNPPAAPKPRKVVVTVDGVKVTPEGTVTL